MRSGLPSRVAEDAPDVADLRSRQGQSRPVQLWYPQQRQVAIGVEQDDLCGEPLPVVADHLRVGLARDDVRVGGHESVFDHEARAVLDLAARDALHLDHRRGHRVRGLLGQPAARRRRPERRGAVRASRRRRGSCPRRRANGTPAARRAARAVVVELPRDPRRGHLIGDRSPTLGQHRQEEPHEQQRPDDPRNQTEDRVGPVQALVVRRRAQAVPEHEADGLAGEGARQDDGDGDDEGTQLVARIDAVEQRAEQQQGDHDPAEHPDPRQHAGDEPEPEADDRGERRRPRSTRRRPSSRRAPDRFVVRDAQVPINRAWVRKPVWATMR